MCGNRHNDYMRISPEYREDVERRILQIMATALESNTLTEADAPLIAKYIIENLDHVEDHQELVRFLDGLSSQWPIFTEVGNIEMAKGIEQNKAAVTHQMEDLVHQGNIQGALDTAQILKSN